MPLRRTATNVAALMPAPPATTFQALVPNANAFGGPIFINNTAVFQALVPEGAFVNET